MSPQADPDFDPSEQEPWEQTDGSQDDQAQPKSRLAYRTAADVKILPVDWLWPGQVPRGALLLINGRQGDGKGTVIASLVASLTTGNPLPDGYRPGVTRCALLSLEDDAERTVAPRLKSAGADLKHVLILDGIDTTDDDGNPIRRPWRMPTDLGALEDLIVEHQLGFVALDPIAYMIGSADGNAYSEVGAILTALSKIAERTGCTIIGVRHLRKSAASDARDAGIGSVAWTAVARVEFVVGRDPLDESGRTRVIAQSKNNLAPLAASMGFVIDQDEELEVGRVVWTGTSNLRARDLTAEADSPDALTDRAEARELLRVMLAHGPVDARSIISSARDVGVGERTLRKAKVDLGVVSEKIGLGGGWQWLLPQGCTEDDHPGQTLAALPSCSLGSDQDLHQPTTHQDPEGCNAARVRGDVPSSASAPPSEALTGSVCDDEPPEPVCHDCGEVFTPEAGVASNRCHDCQQVSSWI